MKLLQQVLFLTTVVFSFGEIIEPTKHDLVRYLLEGSDYDKRFPPNTENVTDVSVQLHITDIDSESDKNMEIELTLNLRMNWTDRRLDFSGNKTTYDVINLGDNIVDNVWIPDLYFIHERKSELHGLFSKNQLVYIHQNGQVFFYSGRQKNKETLINEDIDLTKHIKEMERRYKDIYAEIEDLDNNYQACKNIFALQRYFELKVMIEELVSDERIERASTYLSGDEIRDRNKPVHLLHAARQFLALSSEYALMSLEISKLHKKDIVRDIETKMRKKEEVEQRCIHLLDGLNRLKENYNDSKHQFPIKRYFKMKEMIKQLIRDGTLKITL